MTDPGQIQTGKSFDAGMRRGVLIALALVLAWVAFITLFGPSGGSGDNLPPPRLDGSAVANAGQPMNDRWPLEDLDGKPVDFASFRGRPVLVNLWATWCPPCVAEMPSLARLAADPRMKDVAVVCVSVDGSREAPRRFVEGKGWPMTLLHTAEGVPAAFLTDGIPATFILDPAGRVVASETGAARWDDPSVFAFFARWNKPQ